MPIFFPQPWISATKICHSRVQQTIKVVQKSRLSATKTKNCSTINISTNCYYTVYYNIARELAASFKLFLHIILRGLLFVR